MAFLAGFKLALLFSAASNVHAAGLVKMPVRASLANPTAPVANKVSKLTVSVKAGNGQTFNDVILDTGSPLLWLGGESPYVPGPNTKDTGNTFQIPYGEGGASGLAYQDTVTIGSATVTNQWIGAANFTSFIADIEPLDGFLGLSFNGSNARLISGIPGPTNTFLDSLVQEGIIDSAIWSLVVPQLDFGSGEQVREGEILFGGYDGSKIQGDITWLDIEDPDNIFKWSFNMDGVYFGDTKVSTDVFFLSITDSGNLWISVDIDTYLAIEHSIPGATGVEIGELGFLTFPGNVSISELPPLTHQLGGQNFTVEPENYIIPKAAYAAFNITDDGRYYTWIGTDGAQYATELGQTWLANFYSIYDVGNKRIGLAHYA